MKAKLKRLHARTQEYRKLALGLLLIPAGFPVGAGAADIPGDAAVQAQWFTGSLEAPSPALPQAGILAIEPYFIYSTNTGAYDDRGGRQSVPNDSSQAQSVTVFKYALTDRLSIEALPSAAHRWSDRDRYSGIGDLPVEFEYRFNDENNKTGWPSVTASLGVSFPTGKYNRLHSPLDGLGSGAYTAKEGILFQSLFDTYDHHPVRLRFYAAAFEPIGDASIRDVSTYGTVLGFRGNARPGFATEFGVGGGYALDQQIVLALDLEKNATNGLRLNGMYPTAGLVQTLGDRSSSLAVAPAVEYNFSGNVGIIGGVELSVAGHNSSSYVAPQVAISMAF